MEALAGLKSPFHARRSTGTYSPEVPPAKPVAAVGQFIDWKLLFAHGWLRH